MYAKKLDNAYILRLEYGEELQSSLLAFVKANNIQGGFFNGLGGATSAVLGIYCVDTDKQYHFRDFAGPLEIISLNGNIAIDETGEIVVHTHATISGPDLNVSGGHVKEIQIGGTCEIFLDLRTGKMQRLQDENIGLKLLNLSNE